MARHSGGATAAAWRAAGRCCGTAGGGGSTAGRGVQPAGGGAASDTEGLKATAPAVANGVVYVAGGNSDLYALGVSDGAVLWSTGFAGGQGAASSPVAGNGVVYIAGYDNSVYAFAA